MKSLISLLLAIGLIFSLTACSAKENNTSSSENNTSSSEIDTSSLEESENMDTFNPDNVEVIVDIQKGSDNIMKIGFCFHEFIDKLFYSEVKDYADLSGNAEIIMKDENNKTIFNKEFKFSPKNIDNNFSGSSYDGSYYVFDVEKNEFKRATSEWGTVYSKITLEDGTTFQFEEYKYYESLFYHDIKFPTIPATFSDFTYPGEKRFQITKLEQNSYDANSINFNIQFKLLDLIDSDYTSVEVSIGYKLYDSSGAVVDSGNVFSNSLSIGEKSNATFSIEGLDLTETYTLKLINVG